MESDEHPLHDAVRRDDQSTALHLLGSSDANGQDDLDWTPLMYSRSAAMVWLLLENGANLHYRTSDGETVLMAVARVSTVEAVEALLEAGLNVDDTDQYANTALGEACFGGNVPVIEVLLRAGADPNRPTVSGETPLFAAVRASAPSIVQLLVDHGASAESVVMTGPLQGMNASDFARSLGDEESAAIIDRSS